MRCTLTFAALIASAAAMSANVHQRATPTSPATVARDGSRSINPPIEAIAQRSVQPPTKRVAGHFDTNAKRLAAGLPLKAPSKRNRNRPHAPRQTGTPCTNGYISVSYGSTSGYFSSDLNAYGEYHTVTNSACDASALQVCAFPSSSVPSDIKVINPTNDDTPFLGGITGYGSDSASLSPFSPNYFTLGGVAESASSNENTDNTYTETLGAGYEEPAESEIWSIAVDGTITASWVNLDGSVQDATLGYSSQDAFLGTADVADFQEEFDPDFAPATFKFISGDLVEC